MYLPRSFREDDLSVLHDLVERYSFGTLITSGQGGMVANHYPFLLAREVGPRGTLRAHLAANNPQLEHLRESELVLVSFLGPHAYISPAWYSEQSAVPTWNYAAVHAYGVPRLITDPDSLMGLMVDLVQHHESHREAPWRLDPQDPWTRGLLKGIVGFEITITTMEGKLKLSQNRPEASQLGVLKALGESSSVHDREVAALMAETRQRLKT